MAIGDRTRTKILTYLHEWHGDFWSLRTREREGIAQRIAENATAYFRLLNVPLFQRIAQEMLDDNTIRIIEHEDGTLSLSTEYLDPEKQDSAQDTE